MCSSDLGRPAACGLSGGVLETKADLLGMSGRRGSGCGHGGARRWRRLRSVAWEGESQGEDGDEGVSGRVPGVEAAPRRRREASWWPQAKQTSRVVVWRARARAPSPSSAYWREEEDDREEEVGWACQLGRQVGLGRVG